MSAVVFNPDYLVLLPWYRLLVQVMKNMEALPTRPIQQDYAYFWFDQKAALK